MRLINISIMKFLFRSFCGLVFNSGCLLANNTGETVIIKEMQAGFKLSYNI